MPTPDPPTSRVHGLSSALTPPPSALLPGPPPSVLRPSSQGVGFRASCFGLRSVLRGPVHWWTDAGKSRNCATLCHSWTRAKRLPSRQTRSASRSLVVISNPDAGFSASQKGSWHACPGKCPGDSFPCSLSPEVFHVRTRYPGEGGVGRPAPARTGGGVGRPPLSTSCSCRSISGVCETGQTGKEGGLPRHPMFSRMTCEGRMS